MAKVEENTINVVAVKQNNFGNKLMSFVESKEVETILEPTWTKAGIQ